jgi:allantoate deiminase
MNNVLLPPHEIDALGARAETMIAELGEISAEPARLVRLFLSKEHRRAADLVGSWMRTAGLAVTEDALGTVRGRWQDPSGRGGARRLLIGSHIDTVIDAGKYDGPLGVVAGILAVELLSRRHRPPAFGIDVLAFGDEEGSRFPSNLSTSAAAAGMFDPATLALADRQGVTYGAALTAYGKDANDIPCAAYRRDEAAAYVEVHIEQGPTLEAQGEPLGVVSGIIGQNKMRVTVEGEAGHAGTVPMEWRRDALAAAAELVLAIERIARDDKSDRMVATVGRIDVLPGATNIIPGRVIFTVDLRANSDDRRRDAVAAIKAQAWEIVEARGVQISFDPYYESATTPCALELRKILAASIAGLGLRPVELPSGASHDALMMARLCPSAMMFVRCRGGISHNPKEFASPRDMGLAIAALLGFIDRCDPHRLAGP